MTDFAVSNVCGEFDYEIPSWRCCLDEGHLGPHHYIPFRSLRRPEPVLPVSPATKRWKAEEAR